MKIFKKVITSILACSLVFACCFGLVGCDDITNDETPPTSEPEIEIITLSAEQAEMIYYNALLNSIKQNTRHETVTINSRHNTHQYEETMSTTLVLKDGVSYIREDDEESWIVNHKLYNVKEKKYYTSYGPIDIHRGALEFAQLQSESDSQEIIFLGGEKTGESYSIGIRYSMTTGGEETIYHISAKIDNNLLVSLSMSAYSHAELSYGDGYYQATISYQNVSFPKATPSDLNTYTKAD